MKALQTDLYQLSMAAGYFHRGKASDVATCEMHVRAPKNRSFLVVMGLERFLGYLDELRFDDEALAFLCELPALRDAMTPAFVSYLRALRFTGDVWAVPEGTVVLPGEPIVRVRAPIIEAQLVETFLLSAVNHATMVASKAARMVLAARSGTGPEAQVVEFGTRRTHPDAALDAARAAYCLGFSATSNVEAGRRHGVPVSGTAAHMWTMAHASEEEAFSNYVATFPRGSTLLVDTYDTLVGTERAIRAAGDRLKGVRIDSGDLDALSREVRARLDAAGLHDTKIVVSGDLNETKILALRRAGAPIDVYGVGTELVAPPDGSAMPGVYKLVLHERALGEGGEVEVRPIAKQSTGKGTLPGAHQVWRERDASGILARDTISLAHEPPPSPSAEPLLVPIVKGGERVTAREPLDAIRERAARELAGVPHELRGIDGPPVRREAELSTALVALVQEVRARVLGGAS